jgi:hypothetical protein
VGAGGWWWWVGGWAGVGWAGGVPTRMGRDAGAGLGWAGLGWAGLGWAGLGVPTCRQLHLCLHRGLPGLRLHAPGTGAGRGGRGRPRAAHAAWSVGARAAPQAAARLARQQVHGRGLTGAEPGVDRTGGRDAGSRAHGRWKCRARGRAPADASVSHSRNQRTNTCVAGGPAAAGSCSEPRARVAVTQGCRAHHLVCRGLAVNCDALLRPQLLPGSTFPPGRPHALTRRAPEPSTRVINAR